MKYWNPINQKQLNITFNTGYDKLLQCLLKQIIPRIKFCLPSILPNSLSCALVSTCLYKISASLYFPCLRYADAYINTRNKMKNETHRLNYAVKNHKILNAKFREKN